VVAEPLRLTHNSPVVIIGLTEILMPYMNPALLAGCGRLDTSYEEAAQSLGARPFTASSHRPSSLVAGVALGCLLVSCWQSAPSLPPVPRRRPGGADRD